MLSAGMSAEAEHRPVPEGESSEEEESEEVWLIVAGRTATSVHDPRSFLLLCYADDTIDLLDARP